MENKKHNKLEILIYWHIWVGNDLEKSLIIIKRQYKLLKISKLYNKSKKIYISIDRKNELLLKNIFLNDIKISFNLYDGYVNESFTLDTLYNKSKNTHKNYKILYFHSRGTSLKKDSRRSICSECWTIMLEYFCINKWEDAIVKLKDSYTCGCEMYPHKGEHYTDKKYSRNNIWHYSGNFWWANSKYIKQNLKSPYELQGDNIDTNRYTCGEDWILSSIGSKSKPNDHFTLHRTYLRNKKTPFNIYKNCYHPKYYLGGNLIPKMPLNPFKFDLNFVYFPLHSEKKYFLFAILFSISAPFAKIFRLLDIYFKKVILTKVNISIKI